jgi:hypothetical protein
MDMEFLAVFGIVCVNRRRLRYRPRRSRPWSALLAGR